MNIIHCHWYFILVDGSIKYIKANNVSKNGVATIIHNEYKNVLLNNKCLRGTIRGTYQMGETLLQCLADKTYPKQWMLWISSWSLELIIKKIVTLITIQKKSFFVKL